MDLSGPRSDHLILWTVTDSHGSNGCLVSTLKRRRSTLFPLPYTASFHLFFFLTLSQKSLLASLWNPLSILTRLCLSQKSLSILTLSSLNHSLVSASPSSPSHCRSSAQISSSILTLSITLSFVAVALLQLSPDLFLTLSKSQSLSRLYLSPSLPSQLNPDRSSLSHAHLCLSPSSPSQLTLCLVAVAVVGTLICFFFVNICKLIVDDDIDLKCWCVNWFGSIENWLWMMI